MEKIHSLRDLARSAGGEYVLGARDLSTHACYLIYGELKPGESGRKVCPGGGHEEILLAVTGDLDLAGPEGRTRLPEGAAVHLKEEETYALANPGAAPAIYVLAGGHSGKPH